MLIEGFVAQHFVEDIKCRAWRYIKRIIIAGTVFCSHRHLTVLTAVFPPEKSMTTPKKAKFMANLPRGRETKQNSVQSIFINMAPLRWARPLSSNSSRQISAQLEASSQGWCSAQRIKQPSDKMTYSDLKS